MATQPGPHRTQQPRCQIHGASRAERHAPPTRHQTRGCRSCRALRILVTEPGCGAKTVRVWDVTTGKETTILRGHEDCVRSASFSPDGTRVLTASLDNTARLWDTVPYRVRFAESAARRARR
ncbi:MAG TPA: hypothetical protein VFT55_08125 [Planctomycetota bacterium]|nr:hypothetical protein [Planctomycetota bacterium]